MNPIQLTLKTFIQSAACVSFLSMLYGKIACCSKGIAPHHTKINFEKIISGDNLVKKGVSLYNYKLYDGW